MLTGPSLRFLILIVSTTQLSFIFPYDLFSALKNFWMAEDMSRGRLIMGIYLGYHGVHPAVLKMNARRPENSLPSGFHRVWFWQEMSGQTWLAELQIQLLEVSQDQNLSLSSNGSCAWIKIRFLKKILSAAKTRGENSQYLDLIGHKWDFSLNIYKFTKWLFFFSSFRWLGCHCFKKLKIWENSHKNLDSQLNGKLQGLAIPGLYFCLQDNWSELNNRGHFWMDGRAPGSVNPCDFPVTVVVTQSPSLARPCNRGQCWLASTCLQFCVFKGSIWSLYPCAHVTLLSSPVVLTCLTPKNIYAGGACLHHSMRHGKCRAANSGFIKTLRHLSRHSVTRVCWIYFVRFVSVRFWGLNTCGIRNSV